MNRRPFVRGPHAAASLLLLAVGLSIVDAARANACAGIPHCFDGGNFTANVVQVVTARKDGPTAYHTVRVTLRLRNSGNEPLILAHRLGTNVLIDSNGNAYNYFNNRANRIVGIGLVQPGSADTQFQLAPGEARNATFENVIQYAPARTVLGDRYNFDCVIEQLALIGGQQVRTVRSHALSFTALSRGSVNAAAGGGNAAPRAVAPTEPAAGVASAPVSAAPINAPGTESGSAPPAATQGPAAAAAADPCAPAPHACANVGPFIAAVSRVSVSKKDGNTAYQTVRITLAIRNTSAQPLILGYKHGSHVLVDDRGNRYDYFSNSPQRVSGIGIVQRDSADSQFTLAPGQLRSATFDSVIQYSPRRIVLGGTYNFDLVLVQLEPLSPTQVRSAREFALNYTQLTQATAGAPTPLGAAGPSGSADAVDAAQKAVELFKSLTGRR